ncbi:MAG: hypothetical protein WBP13_05965 [Methylophilaceae bacterium]
MGIFTLKTAYQQRFIDQPYCENENKSDANNKALCLKNTKAQTKVRSIIYYCDDNIMYIGINGKTLPLKRIISEPKQHPSTIFMLIFSPTYFDALKAA